MGDLTLVLISYRLEVTLLEKKPQGQTIPLHGEVATYRLPWNFRVGRRQAGQDTHAAPVGGTVPLQNGADNPCEQEPTISHAPTPRPVVPAPRVSRGNAQEPIIQSSRASPSFSEGGSQGTPRVATSSPQAPAASVVAVPLQRKRPRDEDDLDNGDLQGTTKGRNVRARREKGNNAIAGRSAPVANHSRFQPITTAAGTGSSQRIAPCGAISSNNSPNSAADSATPAGAQPDAPNTEPHRSLLPVHEQHGTSQPTESSTVVLRAANPSAGPISGSIVIWLAVQDLPTAFTLYARFGSNVAATVSSTLYLLPSPLLISVLDG